MPTTCPECGHTRDEHGPEFGCENAIRDPDRGAYPFECTCDLSPEQIDERRAN